MTCAIPVSQAGDPPILLGCGSSTLFTRRFLRHPLHPAAGVDLARHILFWPAHYQARKAELKSSSGEFIQNSLCTFSDIVSGPEFLGGTCFRKVQLTDNSQLRAVRCPPIFGNSQREFKKNRSHGFVNKNECRGVIVHPRRRRNGIYEVPVSPVFRAACESTKTQQKRFD